MSQSNPNAIPLSTFQLAAIKLSLINFRKLSLPFILGPFAVHHHRHKDKHPITLLYSVYIQIDMCKRAALRLDFIIYNFLFIVKSRLSLKRVLRLVNRRLHRHLHIRLLPDPALRHLSVCLTSQSFQLKF